MGGRPIDRVIAIADSRGMNKTQLAAKLGVSPQVITNWIARDLPGHAFASTADALGVSIYEILGRTMGESERSYMANVKAAPPGKYQVREISWVSAGGFNDANDPYDLGDGARVVETDVPVSQSSFALVVRGDSMEPDFPDGCTIIVDPAIRAQSGDFVIVRAQDWDEATFKKYRNDAGVKWLVPLNARYQATQAPFNSVICGVVVEMIPARKRFK